MEDGGLFSSLSARLCETSATSEVIAQEILNRRGRGGFRGGRRVQNLPSPYGAAEVSTISQAIGINSAGRS